MTPSSSRLLGAIRADRLTLERLRNRVAEALTEAPWSTGDRVLYLVAVSIEHYYTGCEAIAERVARAFEGVPPPGPRWHQELLESMGYELPEIRGPLFSPTSVNSLRELLSFRHFMRHAYALDLDPMRLERLARVLVDAHAGLLDDIDHFDTTLR